MSLRQMSEDLNPRVPLEARPFPMVRRLVVVAMAAGALLLGGPGVADDAPRASGTIKDFKMVVENFGVGPERLGKTELVFREGIVYLFHSEGPEEVVVYVPALREFTLIHLKRREQCRVFAAQIEANLDRLRNALTRAVENREASDDRADRVAADMARDFLAPRFEVGFAPESGILTLENESLTVVAVGKPEEDRARLSLVEGVLSSLTKFAALRAPEDVPPFAMLDVIERLCTGHHLRPEDISVVVRLAGPPRKVRWAYRLVPTLTDREREAIRRVDGLRVTARLVPYEAY